MPVYEVVRYVDLAFSSPGFEGDELIGGPVLASAGDLLPVPARYWCTAGYAQPRDNGLGYHGAHDYAPRWNDGRELLVCTPNEGRPIWYARWNGIAGPGGGYGNVVLIEHEDGELTLLAHLHEFTGRVREWIAAGANAAIAPWLDAGEVVGVMGNRGNVWGTRPDGTLGPPLGPGDDATGRHLHIERRTSAALGGILIDLEARIVVVGELPMPAQTPPPVAPPNPYPNTPIELGPVQAYAEAQLFYRLIVNLGEQPLEFGEAIAAMRREAQEMLAAYGTHPALAEVQALDGLLETYEINPVIDYQTLIAAALREGAQILAAIRASLP